MEQYPYWFTHYYKPYKDLMSSSQTRRDNELKKMFGTTNISVEVRNFFIEDFFQREAQARRLLYIQIIDRYAIKGWPKKYADGWEVTSLDCQADLIMCRDAIRTYNYVEKERHNQKGYISYAKISDKLAEAFVRILFDGQYVRNSKQAEELAKILFKALSHFKELKPSGLPNRNEAFGTIGLWIEKDLINPQNYETYIRKFIGARYVQPDYTILDMYKRTFLGWIKKDLRLYIRMVNVFDGIIREFNIEEFNRYLINGKDSPACFKAIPFADGSRMKPVRRWFSWKLE